VRRKVALLLGLAAVVALVRLLLRRAPRAPAERAPDPRAQALAEKLADSRRADPGAAGERIPTSAPAGAVPAASEPGAPDAQAGQEVEAARERVYEEGRAALEEMRRSGEL
jgi:hypothetical protein